MIIQSTERLNSHSLLYSMHAGLCLQGARCVNYPKCDMYSDRWASFLLDTTTFTWCFWHNYSLPTSDCSFAVSDSKLLIATWRMEQLRKRQFIRLQSGISFGLPWAQCFDGCSMCVSMSCIDLDVFVGLQTPLSCSIKCSHLQSDKRCYVI